MFAIFPLRSRWCAIELTVFKYYSLSDYCASAVISMGQYLGISLPLYYARYPYVSAVFQSKESNLNPFSRSKELFLTKLTALWKNFWAYTKYLRFLKIKLEYDGSFMS